LLFNSLTFLVFFAVVLAAYNLPLPWRLKKMLLLVASYVFYAAWNPPFVLLLILAAVVDFHLAKVVARWADPRGRQIVLWTSITLNLGLLAYFKYAGFVLDNFVRLLGQVGIQYQPPSFSIVLPLGISFYTFETISYLVDVYRGRLKPWSSFLDYALFLTFFPHLVAGPIVRAEDFLPQCASPRNVTRAQMGWGLSMMVLGLFEKVVLADAILAPVADQVFGATAAASFTDAWVGTLAFSGQIFFDFAGYSTCGIGAALCFGFVLKKNFNFPYAAVGFSDFWRRWHISLSTWLRDYLYIPLGGNRHGERRTCRNVMLTMLLGGLWHGASWRFVAWGGLHGSYLVAERFVKGIWPESAWARRRASQLLLALLTFGLVSLTWTFFRAETFQDAVRLLAYMCGPLSGTSLLSRVDAAIVLFVTAALFSIQWALRDGTIEFHAQRLSWWLRSVALAGMLLALVATPGDNRAFIYFQF
jgi:D-alanyl-lipoteichoic acid acyltransferase DltB (MBOAT superfamily)